MSDDEVGAEHQARAIRMEAINAYENFMAINASAAKIAAGISAWKLCPGVNFSGCSKSDMARSFATQSHDFKPDTLKVLLSNFGSK